jgi:pyruvate kinase
MSISNTSDIPILAGGFITLPMISKETDETNRRTKIICTIGPACWETFQLETLIDAGMDVGEFRALNNRLFFTSQ